jgi:two-component system sensor histidine kinase/response regulator
MSIRPIKFLLVDDVEENLVALEALLRRDGLEVLQARSGREALELLLIHEVALALVDVQMPEMDGFELAELMRGAERTKHVPIIFVTAGPRDPQRVFKGYESGAVDFLFKPIEPHVLRGKADVFFELYRRREELANLLRLHEMFVGILGHDLRQPLGAIIAGAQLLERQATSEGQLATVRRMAAASERMSKMIEQLLDLTRARMGEELDFAIEHTDIAIDGLVRRIADELRPAHPDRELFVDSSGDGRAQGDPDRLLQLFSNLLSNALVHGAAGSAVSVTVDGRDREIVVAIRNHGTIPAELVPTLFDPFRGRARHDGRSGGLGLGLFISQQIAIAHGGRIDVESSEANGTVFTVALPRSIRD